MLDFADPTYAGREINFAERVRDRRLAITNKQVKNLVSPFWDSEDGEEFGPDGWYSPENHYLDWLVLMLPRCAFSNPKVICTSRRMGPQEEVAVAMKHGQNRWLADSKFEKVNAQLATDYLFNHGVAHISVVDNPTLNPDEHNPNPLWPEVNRISPGDFFRDPLALSPDKIRFAGHSYLIDKEDMISIAKEENKEDKDAGWSIEDIDSIPASGNEDSQRETPSGNWLRSYVEADGPTREQLVVKEVWVKGFEDSDHPGAEKGFCGTIFYYGYPASGMKDGEGPISIREPQPFWGPPTGPYSFCGMYFVTDQPYHLSSLVATEGQIRDLNRHARSMSDSAARYKQLILADNTDPLFADKVRDSEHDLVLAIEGFEKANVANVEIGGVSDQWLRYFGIARDRLDRASGVTQVMRGNTQGGATATADALADQSSDIRIAWIKHQFTAFVEDILSKVGWYMYHNDDIKFPLGRDAADELGVEEGMIPMFEGGNPSTEGGSSFEDLELKIEVMSMEHTSEATLQRRALQLLEILTMVAQTAPAAPYMDWKSILSAVGQGLNIPDLADHFDTEMFGQVVGLQMQEQVVGMEAQLGKQAKTEEKEPVQPLPFLQGQSMGSMFGQTTGKTAPSGAGGE